MGTGEESGSAVKLNLNSYLSLSMIGVLVTVAIWLNTKFSMIDSAFLLQTEKDKTIQAVATSTLEKAKEEVLSQVKDFGVKLDKFDVRVSNLEAAVHAPQQDRWTSTDMFKWAVKLQRENKSMVVPEPTHDTP